jgi:hypothetical protein
MGCTITRMLRPWRSAVWCSGNRRWRRQRVWTDRRCAPKLAKSIRSGAPPAGSCWCVLGSFRAGGRLPFCGLGSVQHEGDTAGRGLPGVSCVWRLPREVPPRSGETSASAPHAGNAGDFVACGAARACHRHDGVEVTRHNLHSARWNQPCQAASVRGLSNEALELHLGAAWGAWCRRSARRTTTLMRSRRTSTLMR